MHDTSAEAIMHLAGLVVGVGMGIPGIIANAQNKPRPIRDANRTMTEVSPLEELPVLTCAALAVGAFIRVPNQVSGLLQSLYPKRNSARALRFGIMSFSSFFAGLVFFVTLWLMGTRLHKDERSKKETALIAAVVCTCILVLTVVYFVYGWATKRAFPSPGSHWDKFLNALQLISLPLAIVAFIPHFVKIHREKGVATEALSVWTTVLYILDSMLRIPNVSKGLFHAIRNKNANGDVPKMILGLAGILLMISAFYATLVCQASYNTDADHATRRDKKTATDFSMIYGVGLLLLMAYMIKGFTDPTFRP